MRLKKEEIAVFKQSLSSLTPHYTLYLFGSRVDDTKKGGDIDLLVVSKTLTKRDLRKVRCDFYERFGEQKIDIVLDDGSFQTTFTRMILPKAIKL